MLTDKTMARLAEDCGWVFYEPPVDAPTKYPWGTYFYEGSLMSGSPDNDSWLLTDAGCWQVARRFFAEGQGTRTWWEFRLYEHDPTMEGGTSDADYLMVGVGLADTPEAALMLAIQEVYADQEPQQ